MTVAALIPVGPVTVRLISEGDRIVGSLKDRGPFEPKSLAKWAELCAGGGTVLDIGAYTGLYAIAARLMGCRAIAWSALGLLLVNVSCPVAGTPLRPLVLLDASLSMGAAGARWAVGIDPENPRLVDVQTRE